MSIFTVAFYSKDVKQMIAIISDKIDHSKVSVTFLLNEIIQQCVGLHNRHMNVILWSDGPSSQFKNRFMYHYLSALRENHGLPSLSWNFFAASHGKSSVDGVGGTLKRIVWNRVRARTEIVRNSKEFFEAAKKYCSGIDLVYADSEEIDYFYSRIKNDLASSCKVPGIQSDHHWLVTENDKFRCNLTPDFLSHS